MDCRAKVRSDKPRVGVDWNQGNGPEMNKNCKSCVVGQGPADLCGRTETPCHLQGTPHFRHPLPI